MPDATVDTKHGSVHGSCWKILTHFVREGALGSRGDEFERKECAQSMLQLLILSSLFAHGKPDIVAESFVFH